MFDTKEQNKALQVLRVFYFSWNSEHYLNLMLFSPVFNNIAFDKLKRNKRPWWTKSC